MIATAASAKLHTAADLKNIREATKLTLHHLNEARSQRILWLLEELGTPYEIKFYRRNAEIRLRRPN